MTGDSFEKVKKALVKQQRELKQAWRTLQKE
jgi:hypothetical protein